MRRAWDADDRGTDRMAFSGPIGDHGNYSGPLSGPLVSTTGKKKKSARFNIPGEEGYQQQQPHRASSASSRSMYSEDGEELVEITLDVHADTVALHSVKPAPAGTGAEDQEASLLDRSGGLSTGMRLEKRNSFGSGFIRTASARVRQISEELRRLTSSRPPGPKIDRSKSAAGHALKGLQFISTKGGDGAKGWAAVEKRFDELATTKEDGAAPTLARNQFGQCIGMKDSKDFATELFDALARRRGITSGAVTKQQLRDFWDQISDTTFDARLQIFFDMVDKNADGRVTEAEVREIIAMSASANRLSKIQEQADEYAALIMEELDPNNLGYIEISNLETLLLQGGAISAVDHSIRTGNSKNLSQMLSQRLRPTEEPNPIKRWLRKAKYFLEDNWKRCWVLALWFACCAGLFAWKFVQYRNRAVFHVMGYCVCAAKGGAETLKFNMALILLPVCRNTITWIRNKTKLGAAVPFDDNINFHKVIAAGIVVGAGFHVISHLTCDFPRLLHATDAEYEPMKPFFGETRPPNYWWFVKGNEGWTGVVIVVLMAIAFTLATPWFRRGKVKLPGPFKRLTGFNAFWYTHHLFIIVYALLIVHGHFLYLSKKWYKKTTWMYLAIPMTIYAAERLTRMLRSSVWPVKIFKVAVYPGNVLTLQVSKPAAFRYKSGQYMFVNCAAVSPFEWHPFSITSAPGEDFLSVHIKVLGDWTSKLREVFAQACRPPTAGKSGMLRADYGDEDDNRVTVPNFPRVLVDGPYGAPAQDYKQYDVVLLVGLGIGATPMISIVKDIVHNLKTLDQKDDLEKAAAIAAAGNAAPTFRTRRAYFYWVTRAQSDFDWFRGVMNEVAESDTHGAIELHNYCTSVYEEGDARSALITMLQSLHHAKNGVDVVTGTRVKSHFAKPNWRNVYKRLAVNHKDQKVGVFYCGNPAPVAELRQLAADFSRKTTTKFDFHKENF